MRSLYAADYLESGCTIPLNDDYAVDTTMWTYVSAYAAAVMSLISGLLILYADRKRSMLMTLYFLISAIGYGLAGASHQLTESKNDWAYNVLGPAAVGVLLGGIAFLMRSGLLYYFFPDSVFANGLWIASNVTIIVLSTLFRWYVLASLWMVIVYAGMSIVYFRQATTGGKVGREWLLVKILAMFVFVAGFLVQYILEGACGVEGYKDCFESCSLADPTSFNNTAIKNVLVGVGVIFLAIAEVFLPSHEFWEVPYDDDEGFSEDMYGTKDEEDPRGESGYSEEYGEGEEPPTFDNDDASGYNSYQ